MPWSRQPTPVFLPGKFHGQRSMAATVHGVTKSWTQRSVYTHTHTHTHTHTGGDESTQRGNWLRIIVSEILVISWSLIFFFQMEKPAGGKRLDESLSNWSRANLSKLFSCNYFKKTTWNPRHCPLIWGVSLHVTGERGVAALQPWGQGLDQGH